MKYIFVDIDGTMFYRDYEHKKQVMPSSTKKTLLELQQQGHKLIVATGRNIYSTKELLKDFLFDGYLCSSGAYVVIDNQVYIDDPFSKEEVNSVVELAKKHHIQLMFECLDEFYVDSNWRTRLATYRDRKDQLRWKDLQDYIDAKVYKITFIAADKQDFLEFEHGIKTHFELCYGVNAEDLFGEISKLNNSKGSVIKKLIQKGLFSYEDSIAIGDSPNDIEMLKQASISIAMGNAKELVKAYADRITEDVKEDGFYLAFKNLNLVGELND